MAVAIVGVIAALILPATISKFNERILDLGYVRETKAIETAVDNLLVGENKDFFSTMMYLNDEPESYESSSGAFLKKYLKVSKYCGDSNGTCFADKYYTYENNDKKEYIPSYKGACASLKNGMSICLQPQIGANSIVGLLDINGPKGPNVWQKDLRLIILSSRSRVGRIETTEEVLTAGDLISLGNGEVVPPENPPEELPTDPCADDYNSFSCCKTRNIADNTDPCCTYEDIKSSNPVCRKPDAYLEVSCYSMMGGNYYSQSGEQRNSWTFDCSKQTVVNPDGHNYEMLLNGKSRTISCEPGAFDSDEEIENCIENSRYMFFKDGVNWDDCDTDVGSELTASRRYGEKVYNGKFSCYFK